MKSLEISQTQFDGGMVNDPRSTRQYACRVCTNFDVFTDPKRMIPYRDSVSGDQSAADNQMQNFAIGIWNPTGVYRLFGLGVVLGTGKAQINMKNLTTGSASDLSNDDWDAPANNQSGSGATSFALFVYYENVKKFFGARAGTNIWAFMTDGTAFADTEHSLSYTNIAQGLVHSKDDCLYIPYDNKIARNNGGSWTDAALTLPSYLKITSIAEDGNFLTIACAPLSGIGQSVVFRWDRDSSFTTLSERVTWGEGRIQLIEELEGYLIGISIEGNNQTRNKSKIIFSSYSSTEGAIPFLELVCDDSVVVLLPTKQKADKRLYFMMSIEIDGVIREGLWSVARAIGGTSFSVVHERTPNNDTPIGNGALKGFFIVGEFVFQSYANNANAFALSKTNDQESYTATAIYETLKYNNGDGSLKKKIIGMTVMTEPLPTNAEVGMLYKKDEETSFTEVFVNAEDNLMSHSAINIEADGTNLPEEKEASFRIESTGGAVITGFSFEPDFVDSRLY